MDYSDAREELKRTPTDADLAEALGVSVKTVRRGSAPEGWRRAFAQLAQDRIRDLKALVVEVRG